MQDADRRVDPMGVGASDRVDVRGTYEVGHEGGGRAAVDRLRRADLVDPPAAHHHDAVRHGQRLRLVMPHVDRRETGLALQAADLAAHLIAQFRVEVGQRLIEQHHARPDRERSRQRHPLLLAL